MEATKYLKHNPATKGYSVHLDRFGNDTPIAEIEATRVPGTPNLYFMGERTAFASVAKAAADLLGGTFYDYKDVDVVAPTFVLAQVGQRDTVFIPGLTDEPLHRCFPKRYVDGCITLEQWIDGELAPVLTMPEDTACYINAKPSLIPELMEAV